VSENVFFFGWDLPFLCNTARTVGPPCIFWLMMCICSLCKLKLKERKVFTDVMLTYAADPAEGVIS
jgi:hypothetical protein